MKIIKLAVGFIVFVLAALMLADGVVGTIGDAPIFEIEHFKLLVAFVLLVLAGAYFEESRG